MMGPRQRIRQCAATALDHALLARVGLTMRGLPRVCDDLDPVIENLSQILRESLSIEDCHTPQEAMNN